ncbi:insulin-like peptide INSL6 isoform X2 [Pongo abelii]|uniref:insulin-like peptide INSL6 isoform X2 n=1 Tax=Pongo abelii TaxID=9601 RepID=UPI003007EACE
MPRLLRLCLLWLGLLLVRFSRELSDISSARKLCGRYLVKEIEKLCGHANWSQFHLGEETPFSRLIAQASEKVEAFSPYQFQSSQTAFPVRGRGTNPGADFQFVQLWLEGGVTWFRTWLPKSWLYSRDCWQIYPPRSVYFLGRSSKQLGNAVTT